jgi:hypothetical protein
MNFLLAALILYFATTSFAIIIKVVNIGDPGKDSIVEIGEQFLLLSKVSIIKGSIFDSTNARNVNLLTFGDLLYGDQIVGKVQVEQTSNCIIGKTGLYLFCTLNLSIDHDSITTQGELLLSMGLPFAIRLNFENDLQPNESYECIIEDFSIRVFNYHEHLSSRVSLSEKSAVDEFIKVRSRSNSLDLS